jgi:hypothetical protein
VVDAERAIREETGESAAIALGILDILTRSRARALVTDAEKAENLVRRSRAAKSRVTRAIERAHRERRRFYRRHATGKLTDADCERYGKALGDIALAKTDAREAEEWIDRRRGAPDLPARRVTRGASEVMVTVKRPGLAYREPRDRLSLEHPSRSTAFGDAVLEPLWRIVRERAPDRRDISDRRVAGLILGIVRAWFPPTVTKGLTAEAIRRRVVKAHERKGE